MNTLPTVTVSSQATTPVFDTQSVVIPSSIIGKISEVATKQFSFEIPQEVIFSAQKDGLAEVTKEIYRIRDQHEKCQEGRQPGAGYTVSIQTYGRNRPAKVSLLVVGDRQTGTPLESPTPAQCGLCKAPTSDKYQELSQSHARIIFSNEKNPLILSTSHARHAFELPQEIFLSMLTLACQTIEMIKSDCSRRNILFQIGTHGGQTAGHPHAHISGSFTEPNS